jgi:hypothetical protein
MELTIRATFSGSKQFSCARKSSWNRDDSMLYWSFSSTHQARSSCYSSGGIDQVQSLGIILSTDSLLCSAKVKIITSSEMVVLCIGTVSLSHSPYRVSIMHLSLLEEKTVKSREYYSNVNSNILLPCLLDPGTLILGTAYRNIPKSRSIESRSPIQLSMTSNNVKPSKSFYLQLYVQPDGLH